MTFAGNNKLFMLQQGAIMMSCNISNVSIVGEEGLKYLQESITLIVNWE
jgi:hypothetical protein